MGRSVAVEVGEMLQDMVVTGLAVLRGVAVGVGESWQRMVE